MSKSPANYGGYPCNPRDIPNFDRLRAEHEKDKKGAGICVRCGGNCVEDYDGALCSRCAGESGS